MEQVILVNEADQALGVMEKLEAHEKGLLHRAVSVLVFNSKGQVLLQQRAKGKYHSASLWSNTCCSHPRPGEDTQMAAERRLMEEMGLKLPLEKKFSFIYKTPFGNGLTEYEFDHVFLGHTDLNPIINPEEVENFRWIDLPVLKNEIKKKPEAFSSWFKLLLDQLV